MWSGFPLFPEQASTHAASVDALYFFLIALTAFFSLLIGLMVLGFAVRYRRRSPDDRPPAIYGSLALELTWTVIPLGIVAIIFFWSVDLYLSMNRVPKDAIEVNVVGKRWMWKVQHMTGQREINELHVPVGVPVKLTLTSEDVIHSFFVPAFRVKKDALPGALHDRLVPGHEAGPLPPVLRRVLRHPALGHDRVHRGDGAGRVPGLAGRRRVRRIAGLGG